MSAERDRLAGIVAARRARLASTERHAAGPGREGQIAERRRRLELAEAELAAYVARHGNFTSTPDTPPIPDVPARRDLDDRPEGF